MTNTCPVTGKPCRHLGFNMEVIRIPIVKQMGGVSFPTGKEETVMRPDGRGGFCNNEGKYVNELQICPNDSPAPITHTTTTHHPGQQKIEGWI